MAKFIEKGRRFRLTDPSLAPAGASFLWNRKMMVQVSAQGYAVAQYMDPEPRKYAHAPTLAAQTFMQPEQAYFDHHPGRFFYIKDIDKGSLWSAPYAPVFAKQDHFAFEPGISDMRWCIEKDGVRIDLQLGLTKDEVLELWSVRITNIGNETKNLSMVPYFPVGYSSWMNMGGHYDPELESILCTSITPYQKVEQYFDNRHLKDITFLAASRQPDHFEVDQRAFEGEGGLRNPKALQNGGHLLGRDALYEVPACIMQWDISLEPGASQDWRFLFGPAKDRAEIARLKKTYLDGGFETAIAGHSDYVATGQGQFWIDTPDEMFNQFVNHWLPRQVFYHGDCNRLTTDPQTRNYLQDAMGMLFINPATTRVALLRVASQQFYSGKVPDGILLTDEAELKYINQIPHTDHAVWLVLTLKAYLDETGDLSVLNEASAWADSEQMDTLLVHATRAIDYLAGAADERGLPYIDQGDWCDPMNMVGYKGKGVSGWLAEAASMAMSVMAEICTLVSELETAERMEQAAFAMNERINSHFWDGAWYGRGITDDNKLFGVSSDEEGRIFLNAQSWAILCGAASEARTLSLLNEIDSQLDTPFGAMLCAPAFTAMREDIGRVTQKWPGSAENGSVYNHAAIFYAAALFKIRDADRAFSVMRKMLTSLNEEDIARRGQLPLFIPNYYRGAYYQFPRPAGRSSNLFNTGTVSWYYRLLIEQFAGIRGAGDGVIIDPQFPCDWKQCSCSRMLRGSTFEVDYSRDVQSGKRRVFIDGVELEKGFFEHPESGRTYSVVVKD